MPAAGPLLPGFDCDLARAVMMEPALHGRIREDGERASTTSGMN